MVVGATWRDDLSGGKSFLDCMLSCGQSNSDEELDDWPGGVEFTSYTAVVAELRTSGVTVMNVVIALTSCYQCQEGDVRGGVVEVLVANPMT